MALGNNNGLTYGLPISRQWWQSRCVPAVKMYGDNAAFPVIIILPLFRRLPGRYRDEAAIIPEARREPYPVHCLPAGRPQGRGPFFIGLGHGINGVLGYADNGGVSAQPIEPDKAVSPVVVGKICPKGTKVVIPIRPRTADGLISIPVLKYPLI